MAPFIVVRRLWLAYLELVAAEQGQGVAVEVAAEEYEVAAVGGGGG
jgi:hypothetical protein